jgi:ABC-type antimicrobial peptide transport system permease subunit
MTFLLSIIGVALKVLSRNKMRSALTMVGIMIGVGAVITMVSIGQDASGKINSQIVRAEIGEYSSQVMTILLASIAFVSLVVGGIGVTNIMLVSVTERTREIGIRMAVGSTAAYIQLQFLIEAVVLAAAGGALGILCGSIASKLISDSLGLPAHVSAFATGLALSFSCAMGISAGWYPARKAAGLDPVKALRHG